MLLLIQSDVWTIKSIQNSEQNRLFSYDSVNNHFTNRPAHYWMSAC
ncbi:hypothetical protein JCM19239_360 [Vibrio variabilis]|uniref:Uncharacterized protein n=1 Tax=Vibrio variabilis TaxID=990271 RepID=A0ABQ0JCF5_9VIBR|nr:hypothetical protein JCM19239_360 [Vibrio variabilis]